MSKRKLLLADDSITIQKVVNLTFADEGIEVIAVGDGDAAMRKFEEFLPDLVMADVNMPGMNGYEICEIVKKNDITKHIPVILLVGSFEPFDEEAARAAGADDFLTKPFQSIRQLVNKVTDFLNRPSGAAVTDVYSQPDAELPEPVAETTSEPAADVPTDFGDAGMDDEMIETSPAAEFASGFESVPQNETTIDYAKTQPLSADDIAGFTAPAASEAQVESDAVESGETENDSDLSAQTETVAEPDTDETSAGFESPSASSDVTESTDSTENADTDDSVLDYYSPGTKMDASAPIVTDDVSEPAVEAVSEEAATEEAVAEVAEPAAAADETETGETETGETETADEGADSEPESAENVVDETQALATADESDEIREELPSEPASFVAENTEEAEAASETTDSDDTADTAEADSDGPAVEFSESPASEFVSEAPAVSAIVDDGDLLELPPLIDETGIRPPADAPVMTSAPEPETEPVAEVSEGDAGAVMSSFPPELIDAIAKKVAEQISAKTMSDVLPQITELVLKKMAEEKKD